MLHLPLYNPVFEALYRDFIGMIRTKGYSRGINCMYPSCVREFLFFIENKGITTIQQVEATEIIAYHEYISTRPNQRREGGLSDGMIKSHLFSLRLFFDYLLDIGELDSSPARLPKFTVKRHKERNILSVEEIKQLYSSCENMRDIALISVAYGCGLRRNEIYKLDVGDVHLHKGILIVRDSKNHKNRTIPVSDGVLKNLKDYIIYERPKYLQHSKHYENAFFVNERGDRWSGAYMNYRLHELIERTQNPEIQRKEITLHCLRHSIATHLLDNGATIEFVQQFLGHSDIDTAHIYAKKRKQRMAILSQIR